MRIAVSLALLALVRAARAEDTTGRVRSIYYEAGRGVLVDPSLLRRPSAPRWAEVELADKQRVLVQVPSGMDAKIGDLVAVQLAQNQILHISRVSELRTRATQLASPAP